MARKHSNDGDPMKGGKFSGSMMPGMGGEKGMSPRKAIAGAGMREANTGGKGDFGVASFEDAQSHSGHHPDHIAGTGGNTLGDHERGVGHPIHHTRHHHPAQAAPHHGPHHPDGHMDHHNHGHRGGREARHRGG